MEKDDGRKFPEARFTGDQGSVEDLERLLKTKKMKGKLDFIIDDGSHVPIHQITSFKYLWKNGLKPGGIYIVEDTVCLYIIFIICSIFTCLKFELLLFPLSSLLFSSPLLSPVPPIFS